MLAERKIDLAMWINLGGEGETAITDGSAYNKSAIPANVTRYAKSFQILETEDIVEGGFF